MKTKVQWLPCTLYFCMVLIWINGSIDNFLQSDNVSLIALWCFRLLAIYTTLLILISFLHWLISNELKIQKENGS